LVQVEYSAVVEHGRISDRVARFLFVKNTKMVKILPTYPKMYQMAIRYTIKHNIPTYIKHSNILHSKALQNIPKLGILA
jgi:hypothetical protein